MDNIDKIKYIKQALEKINLNLLSVKIEEVVNYLSKFQDLTNIDFIEFIDLMSRAYVDAIKILQ